MLDETYIVERSKPLVWAQFQDYGIGELKILDTYLSRINAREPESSVVTFSKKEYAELMGLDPDIRTSQLKKYTGRLLRNVVTIDLPDHVDYVQYPLFSEAKCYMDEKLGQVMIQIQCNEKLKPAFFGLSENGYIKYQLKNIIALTSQFSVRLYPRLKDRPYGWVVEVDELRKLLGATAPTYQEFKRFNNLVIQKAVKEINEITDIIVEAKTVKQGRSVVAVRFNIKQKSLPVEDQPAPELPEPPKEDGPLDMVMAVLPEGFTREQGEMLYSLAVDHLPYTVASFDEKHLWISDYVQDKVRLMRTQRKPVAKNAQFSWIRKAVENNWK